MGEVIRRSAAVDDIFADLRTTYTSAQAAGGVFQTLADETVKPALVLCEAIDAKMRAAQAKAAPLVAAQEARNAAADRLVARVSDDVWNEIDRPGRDPQYDLLFPNGITYYTEITDEEQPARMELLAELLEAGMHDRLDPAKGKDYGQQLRKEAAAFESAIDAARKPRAQATMYERMRTATLRSAQGVLASYKRRLKAQNIPEARIHAIIPDRPAPVPAPAAKPPTPAPAPAPPAPAGG